MIITRHDPAHTVCSSLKPSRFSRPRALSLACAALVACALSGCTPDEVILQGERIDLRAPLSDSQQPVSAMANADEIATGVADAPSFTARRASNNNSWTHTNGSPQHIINHPALSSTLRPIWSVSIGEGDTRGNRITATPVVQGGRIFTLDSQSRVMAHGTNGATLWSRNLTPKTDSPKDATGGGLAISGDTLVATTGFGDLVAINAKTGGELWTQRFDANLASAATIFNGLVYVISRDNVAWAINLKDGRIKWQLNSAPSPSSVVGGAAPAISNNIALFPFSSGEIIGTFPKGGVRLWSSSVSGRRANAAYAGITDITSAPVIVGSSIYVGNASGRTVKLNTNSGEVIWTAREGAYGPVWPEGNSVFLVNDQAAVVRLSAATGETLWKVDLPYFQEEKVIKREKIYTHYGPVLAGGRLWVGSSDQVLRSFDPQNGQLMSQVSLPGGASSAPIVVGQTLYIVTSDGVLRAFR